LAAIVQPALQSQQQDEPLDPLWQLISAAIDQLREARNVLSTILLTHPHERVTVHANLLRINSTVQQIQYFEMRMQI